MKPMILDNRYQRVIFTKIPTLCLEKNNFNNNTHYLFNLKLTHNSGGFFNKLSRDHSYLVIKQKRYVPKKFRYKELPANFIYNIGFKYTNWDLKTQRTAQGGTRAYAYNKQSPLAKRLLRTRRMLVLPAHVNLAVITNSFDVIHS